MNPQKGATLGLMGREEFGNRAAAWVLGKNSAIEPPHLEERSPLHGGRKNLHRFQGRTLSHFGLWFPNTGSSIITNTILGAPCYYIIA